MTPVDKDDSQWRKELTPEQYRVLRSCGTERAGTSPLLHEHREGAFACAGCGQILFESGTKYDSGSGWPSFWQARDGAIETLRDTSHGMIRTETRCSNCGGHLGHLFPDGPAPTGLRYCMNGVALTFVPKED